jgi:hypothetical protein
MQVACLASSPPSTAAAAAAVGAGAGGCSGRRLIHQHRCWHTTGAQPRCRTAAAAAEPPAAALRASAGSASRRLQLGRSSGGGGARRGATLVRSAGKRNWEPRGEHLNGAESHTAANLMAEALLKQGPASLAGDSDGGRALHSFPRWQHSSSASCHSQRAVDLSLNSLELS